MLGQGGNREGGPEVIGERGVFKMPRMPRRPAVVLTLAGIVVLLVLSTAGRFLVYVHPNEYGIKEVKIGLNRGIHEKVYAPGWAFVIPFGMENMHLFPRDVQVLELTAFPNPAGKPGASEQPSRTRFFDHAAHIQTSDGFYVDVDVTILYRIEDPYKLITTIGPGQLYLHNGILPKAEPILKEAFGELNTEDFYNSPLRVEKADKAQTLLNAELKPKGIAVDTVLLRYFKYSDEIQKNIEEKKLQDQLVFKNQAERKAAMEEASLKRTTQEGEMKVKVTTEQGQAYKVQKDASRDLYVRKKEAEADLLVQLAEARRTEMKNAAMQVTGAERMVAMQMAEVLQGLDTIIVPTGGDNGLNPLDLDQLATLFGGTSQDVAADLKPAGSVVIPPAEPIEKHETPPPPILLEAPPELSIPGPDMPAAPAPESAEPSNTQEVEQ